MQSLPDGSPFFRYPPEVAHTLPRIHSMEELLKGTAVAPGLVAGRAYVADLARGDVQQWFVLPDRVEDEVRKYEDATKKAVVQLEDVRKRFRDELMEQDAKIFAFHAGMIQDPVAVQSISASIRDHQLTAEAAIQRHVTRTVRQFERIPELARRNMASDVQDAFSWVRMCLQQIEREDVTASEGGVVLVGDDLNPSLTTLLPRDSVIAIVTERGGPYSHGAVLARSMGIPTVVGVHGVHRKVRAGEHVIVDVRDDRVGLVKVRPTAKELEAHAKEKARYDGLQTVIESFARRESATADGYRIPVLVNLESLSELTHFDVERCDGVGLFRTEFLYMERQEFPSEEEQFAIYSKVIETLEGRPVVFRTLDIGNDKRLPYFAIPDESNPALGWRGLRISLHWRDLFLVQLRALLRASALGPMRILLPMVTAPSEVYEVRKMLEDVKGDLERDGKPFDANVQLGAMIEVPAAIYCLRDYAREIEFLSIGTNDLVQYLLAVDRDNPWVGHLYDPYHPSVLRAIHDVIVTAEEHSLEVSICGEMAGVADGALALVALGARELSMSPHFIPEIKMILSQVRRQDLEELKRLILTMTSPDKVKTFLRELIEAVRLAVSHRPESSGKAPS